MQNRPILDATLRADEFREYYYLKEELVNFCRANHLPTKGGKIELTDRISGFLENRKVIQPQKTSRGKKTVKIITEDTVIEANFVCSQMHRSFFKERIGKGFSFTVPFQQWLKGNSGKTYREAIEAYYELKEKKTEKTSIGRQFEYNTYIRDFFTENKGKSLEDAIVCWKYKKSLQGHNRYDESDLVALTTESSKESDGDGILRMTKL